MNRKQAATRGERPSGAGSKKSRKIVKPGPRWKTEWERGLGSGRKGHSKKGGPMKERYTNPGIRGEVLGDKPVKKTDLHRSEKSSMQHWG